MTGAELRQAGETLYGRRWKAPLARRLHINPSTIWRYTKLEEIPERAAIAVRSFLENHKRMTYDSMGR